MVNDKYIIHINMPIEKGNIISEIKSLARSSRKRSEPVEPEQSDEPLVLSSFGKKKKKKKKNKLLEVDFLGVKNDPIVEDGEDSDEKIDAVLEESLIDIDEILNRDDEDKIDEDIIDEQRRSYDKLKKEENPYKKEFAEELTLLYNLLDEMNKFGQDLEKKYKSLESSKVRGISKYTNDLIMSIISTKSNKLSVLKEIANIKKTIADLKIKMDAKNKATEGSSSLDQIASSYFNKVLGYGRNRFIRDYTSSGVGSSDEIDEIVEEIEEKKNEYRPWELENIQRAIEERLENEENVFRSEAGNKYIEYENRDVKIYVNRCIDTGEWHFVALDRNMQRVDDYPLPKKRDIGKVKFSDDGRYATDERGRTFKVLEYFSTDDN